MEKQEQTEWDAVNRLLQHHGFKPVRFADPTENKNLADLVLLERTSAAEMRNMLKTMLADSERRQALIQELIQSNSQLKEEVEQQQIRAARQSQRAEELEDVLASVKVKVQGLEDSFISKAAQQHGHLQNLQQEKKEAEKRCQALQQQLSEQKELVSDLQRKLSYAVKEEERRVSRQNQAFQQIQNRSVRAHSPSDQLILDVIDVYESQLQQLRDKLKSCQKNSSRENDSSDSLTTDKTSTDISALASSNYKALLKSYQEQLRKTKAQREDLKNEIQRLKQDLESRPTVKELKSCKQQLRRMDRIIQLSNIKPAQKVRVENPAGTTSTENQQNKHCKRYLEEIRTELKVQDMSHVVSAVKARCREADSAIRLEKVINEITAVLTSPRAPLGLLKQPADGHSFREHSQQGQLELIVPTLEFWSQQLSSLPDLHRSLGRLVKRLLPWQPEDRVASQSDSVKVEDVMLLVDLLLDETSPDDKILRSPTKHTLEAMVAHFQKLFDAPRLSGVYPRMNEVYSRLGEMTNAMRNLRDVLDMDDRAPPSEVVNTVARIVSSPGSFSGQGLQDLLGTCDIDSIIMKLKEHEEFFPAFHSLVLELLQVLDAESLDDILPIVRSLKSAAA
ncbi:centrosomal protein of 70 kDa [Colossoma macropomum]|uniref:centrosomal protein of 70 kDa n=1 Tax=Colossoma macropomum TaxID=42526 RepID=UPI001863C73E|nr:centrosomal protein of 70 kDa [Colossoma macropomum]XP_036417933.1 centrosomal protein of 70 kDa [Colossoma macropomum]